MFFWKPHRLGGWHEEAGARTGGNGCLSHDRCPDLHPDRKIKPRAVLCVGRPTKGRQCPQTKIPWRCAHLSPLPMKNVLLFFSTFARICLWLGEAGGGAKQRENRFLNCLPCNLQFLAFVSCCFCCFFFLTHNFLLFYFFVVYLSFFLSPLFSRFWLFSWCTKSTLCAQCISAVYCLPCNCRSSRMTALSAGWDSSADVWLRHSFSLVWVETVCFSLSMRWQLTEQYFNLCVLSAPTCWCVRPSSELTVNTPHAAPPAASPTWQTFVSPFDKFDEHLFSF